LLHQVVGYAFANAIRSADESWSVWPLIVASSVFVGLVSSFSYFLIERPMNSLGRRFVRALQAA